MSRTAEILVLPADLATATRAELASLRDRVAQAESASPRLDVPDLAVCEHISRQGQLLRALLRYEEMRDADAGNSPVALEVQRHLNKIEGRADVKCAMASGGRGLAAVFRNETRQVLIRQSLAP